MTTEELLKPRYKVIALWIKSPSKIVVGDIIRWDDLTNDFYCKGERFNKDLESYPHLFKKLEWWEDRDVKDLPEYLKYRFMSHCKDEYFKVESHYLSSFGEYNKNGFVSVEGFWSYSKSYPATEQEYNEYNSTIKP